MVTSRLLGNRKTFFVNGIAQTMRVQAHFYLSFAIVLLLLTQAAEAGPTTLLYEDFEGTLSQWTGKFGGAHSGLIVPDPLASGRGGVLTFTSRKKAGDIFSINPLVSLDLLEIEFDYLGLPTAGSVPDDLGGFIGLSPGLNDGLWIAGTSTLYYPEMFQLIDDGEWRSIKLKVRPPTNTSHLMLEDWLESGGVSGDVFFDNIVVRSVPEPGTCSFLLIGMVCIGVARTSFANRRF